MSVFPEDAPTSHHPGYVAGRYYPGYPATTASTAIPAVDTIYFAPVRITSPLTFDRLGVRVITGVSSALLKIGLWASDPITKKPIGAPIVADDTGLDCATSTTSPELAATAFLAPGLYWFGGKSGHAPTLMSFLGTGGVISWDIGRSINTSMVGMLGYSMAHALAEDMPTLTGAESISDLVTSGAPMAWFRAA